MMRKIKLLCAYVLILLCAFTYAQKKYSFIPNDQYALTETQLERIQINITPEVLLFNEKGKLLSMSSLSLMTNPDYNPIFYANNKGEIKSVVFIKKNNTPLLIEKNPEAYFAPGEKALDFIGTDLNGTTYKLSELQGKVIVLNFWFTKCGPCVSEMPQLNELVTNFENEDVIFLAITFNKKDIVTKFLETNTFNYTILANANDIVAMYGVNSYPTSIVINKKGEIVLKELGYRTNIKEVLATSINASL